MWKIPKQSYTEEFKLEAVKLVESGQRPVEVARQLGIKEQTLSNWRKAAKAGKLHKPGGKLVTPQQMELSRLRTENQRLKMEMEILKKAAVSSMGRRNTVIQLICWRKKPQGLSWALIQPQGDFV
jgi:transposase